MKRRSLERTEAMGVRARRCSWLFAAPTLLAWAACGGTDDTGATVTATAGVGNDTENGAAGSGSDSEAATAGIPAHAATAGSGTDAGAATAGIPAHVATGGSGTDAGAATAGIPVHAATGGSGTDAGAAAGASAQGSAVAAEQCEADLGGGVVIFPFTTPGCRGGYIVDGGLDGCSVWCPGGYLAPSCAESVLGPMEDEPECSHEGKWCVYSWDYCKPLEADVCAEAEASRREHDSVSKTESSCTGDVCTSISAMVGDSEWQAFQCVDGIWDWK